MSEQENQSSQATTQSKTDATGGSANGDGNAQASSQASSQSQAVVETATPVVEVSVNKEFDAAVKEASSPTVRQAEELQPESELPAPSFDDFKAFKENGVIPEKGKEEVKPTTEVKAKAEVKAEVKPVSKEVTKNNGQKVTKRDYTGFPEEEHKYLDRMSNDALDWIRPQLLEKKNLATVLAAKDKEIADLKVGKVQLPENYFEHPQAFVLTPEYNKAAQNLNTAHSVLTHWQKQLANIRQGGTWEDLAVQDGKIVKTAPIRADAEAEGKVYHNLNFASNQLNTYQNEVNTIQQGFRGRHEEAVKLIKDAEKQHFSDFEEQGDKHPYMPVVKNLLNSMPAEFRNNPLSTLLAKSGARTIQAMNLFNEMKVENVKLNEKIKELEKTGGRDMRVTPTNGDVKDAGLSSARGSSLPEVSFDDFKKLKN